MQPDGSFEYQPAAGFVGDDRFGYTVSDASGGIAMGTARVSVGPVAVGMDALVAGVDGFVIDGELADDESGFWVAGGGDVNGDGLDDLLVTTPLVPGGAGRIWVVHGRVAGPPVELADVSAGTGGFVIEGEVAGDGAGTSAAIVGDVDGDGLADVLIGAPGAGPAGRAYLVHGKADGAAVALADVAMGIGGFVLEGDVTGEDAGTAVAGAGDVDGDGRADLMVGAPEGGPIPGAGRTYVVHGKADTTAVALADVYLGVGGFVVRGAGFDDNSGTTVAGAGDVNGDGLADVLVGAQLANAGGNSNSGRCYVVFGRTSTNPIDVSSLGAGGFFIDGVAALDEACTAIAGLGDVNGDGRSDVAVGVPYDEDDLLLQGRTYVVFGKADSSTVLLANVATGAGGFVVDGESTVDFLGLAVAGPGDMDGDGFADLGLGTPNMDMPGLYSGRGYVVFGKSDGAGVPLADLTVRLGGFSLVAEAANDELGWAVGGAGDVDGDGFGDLVISARRANPPSGVDAGRSYVVLGGNLSGALTQLGDDGDDVLVGGPGLDVIVAGAGADEIHGEGGSDVLYAGAGDDLIGVRSGQLFRVRGERLRHPGLRGRRGPARPGRDHRRRDPGHRGLRHHRDRRQPAHHGAARPSSHGGTFPHAARARRRGRHPRGRSERGRLRRRRRRGGRPHLVERRTGARGGRAADPRGHPVIRARAHSSRGLSVARHRRVRDNGRRCSRSPTTRRPCTASCTSTRAHGSRP